MEYFTSKSKVHWGLATRNVLLVNEDLGKVIDFGMSRLMSNENYYYQSTKEVKFL